MSETRNVGAVDITLTDEVVILSFRHFDLGNGARYLGFDEADRLADLLKDFVRRGRSRGAQPPAAIDDEDLVG